MNISFTSSGTAASSIKPLAATTSAGPLADTGDGSTADPTARAHRHGGGHVLKAVAGALKSIGLSLPTPGTDASSATASSSSTDSSSDSSSTSSVKGDLQQFLHSLFEGVKSDASSSASGSGSPSSGDSKAGIGSGLTTLIAQVSNGNAPADLQTAFNKLASDLQPAGSASPASATSTPGTASAASPTLQAFLTALQQNLGYGSSAAATGTLLAAQV